MNEIIHDIDGNIYPNVKIGNQIWMAENLKTSVFSNGTPICMLTNSYEWQNFDTPCLCLYNNEENNLTF